MKLFEIDPDTNEVKINKPWLKLIPEFKALFDGRTMSGVPARMELDGKGRQRLTYIYFIFEVDRYVFSLLILFQNIVIQIVNFLC